MSAPVGARGVDAPGFLFPPQPPPQPRVALVPGDDPVPSVQARVQNVACPPLCTTLWTALRQRRVVVHRCVHLCGSGVRTCLGPSWFLGKHVAPRCRLRGPQVSALRCSGLLRMPVRASDAIHATPASADSLPWGVPRETELPGPGTCVRGLAVHDPRRRRVRGFRGTSCPASAGPVVPTWKMPVAGNSAVSVAVIPSCQRAQCTVSRETLAKVRRPGLSDRSYVASRDAW